MDKRKKWDASHWVTPGVFSGSYVVDEAVQRVTIVKAYEKQEEDSLETIQELVLNTSEAEPSELVLEIELEPEPATEPEPEPEAVLEMVVEEPDDGVFEQVQKLEQEVLELREALASWEERWSKLEAGNAKEMQYLYQVVLSLKKEWENERNEHRNY